MPQPTPPFRARVERIAMQALAEAVPRAQVAQAAARVALAFGAAHRTARDPSALEACTDASIGACVALSALTGLMPGGSHALVYLVPQAPRRGEPPELQWRPTHRAYSALALEDAGLVLLPVAVRDGDRLEVAFGEVAAHEPGDDGEVLGVYVTVRRASDGVVLSRPWVPAATLARVRSRSRAGRESPWETHPEEMAMAAAIRWCHGRGMIPSCSTRLAEAMADEESVAVVQAGAEAAPTVRPRARLPEPVEGETWEPAREREREREPVRCEQAQQSEEDMP